MQSSLARAFAVTTPGGKTMDYRKSAGEEKFEKMFKSFERLHI